MKLLDVIQGIKVYQQDSGLIEFVADMDIDADGANGQNGKQPAYMVGDKGSEALANGGMRMQDGEVVFAKSWARDIVLHDGRKPLVFPGGVIASKTAFRRRHLAASDPAAYLDSAVIPYMVVTSTIRLEARGIILGCRGELQVGEKIVPCMVGDIGPATKIGEASIAAAIGLGIPSNPRTGGTSKRIVTYRIFPGQQFTFAGETFELQRA